MRKQLLVLLAITAVSLIAATLGHLYCREFCMLFKPISWPFVALAVMISKNLIKKGKSK